MELSCAFPPSPSTPDHIAAAEALGYQRAWLYDSPALYPDVWVTLARAAERTSTIGLGPAVLVPSLRHPMVNAAAIATLADLAPGRVAVALGTGFTGRHVLGQRPMTWDSVTAYLRALRGLLAGREVVWEGATTAMIHPDGFAPARPIEVPFLLSAMGPRGLALARAEADGVFSVGFAQGGFAWSAVLVFGTVIQPGEDPAGERVLAAAGPGATVMYHALWEQGGAAGLPGGAEWVQAVSEFPEAVRHLRVHQGHLTSINDWDRPLLTPELIGGLTLTGTADDVAARLTGLAGQGATEVVYQPTGPDPIGELERFASVALV